MNDSWERLYAECSSCTACALAESRTNCVFGAGSTSADLLFVGEAPGENEDKSGTPFVGRAGKLLNEYLDAAGIGCRSHLCRLGTGSGLSFLCDLSARAAPAQAAP